MSNYKTYPQVIERLFLVILILGGLFPAFLAAEGVKQLAPTADDAPVMLETGRPEFGNFAYPDGPVNGRLYVSVASANETIYLGLPPEYKNSGLPYVGNLLWTRYLFRIRRDDGLGAANPIVHPAAANRDWFTVGEDNANVFTWENAEFGQYETTATQFGESIFAFQPGQAGDYYIEIKEYFSSDEEDWVSLPYWDITVADNDEAQPGRVWSRNWAFRTPNVINGVADPCIWNKSFNGQLYSYTSDGFVSRIDFANSGMQGLSFNLAFNSSGPGNSGDLATDRQSVPGVNLTQTSAEHKIFLEEPDIALFPDGLCGEIMPANSFICTGAGEYCLDVEVTKAGQVEIILDFDRNGQLDDNSLDLSLIYEFSNTDLSACIPWDGLRGDGTPISFTDTIDLIFVYSQGVQHWSAYDLEFMKNGYCIETIRPLCSASEGQSTNLYWDDRNIAEDPGNGAEKDGRDGCPCESGCRTWDNFDIGVPTCEEWMSDSTTSGFGDKTTLNTWWFANTRTLMNADIPLVTIDIAGPDSICLGSTAVFEAVNVDATGQVTYSWSGPGVSNESNSSLVVSQGGEYCLTVIDEINCSSTTCQNLIAVDNSNDVVDYPSMVRACVGEEIVLTPAGSTGNSSYSWLPITGLSDPNSPSPSFTITEPITYIVTIGAGNFVCTFTDTVVVQPYPVPAAAFDFSFGCNSLEYTFNSTSVNADSLYWDFGDPASTTDNSNASNPNYLYPQPGSYTVQLLVYSEGNCLDQLETTIEVTDTPPITLALAVNGTVAMTDPGSEGTAANPFLICEPTATIVPTAESGVSFEYFDDQGNSLGTGNSYALPASGSYAITVLATKPDGCEISQEVSIIYGPVDISATSLEFGCNALAYDFTSTVTGADSLYWDFGDPASTADNSNAPNPSYTYTAPGTYTIQLFAFSDEGCTDMTSFIEVVTDTPPIDLVIDVNGQNVGPDLSDLGTPANPILICDPLAIITPDVRAGVTYQYFDAQSNLLASGPSYQLPESGTFAIRVLATNADGCEVEFVVNLAYGPVEIIATSLEFGCNALAYDFTSTISGADSLVWDFGDPTTTDDISNAPNPSYVYPGPGTYEIQLWAFSDEGCLDGVTLTEVVTDTPPIDLVIDVNGSSVGPELTDLGTAANPLLICDPTATLIPMALTGVTYEYFDEGGNTVGTGSSYEIPTSGTYAIVVLATNADGCIVTFEVNLAYAPVEAIQQDTAQSCNTLEISFSSLGTGADSLYWNFGVSGTNTDVSNETNPVFVYPSAGTYQVQLWGYSAEGCIDFAFSTVEVVDTPIINLQVDAAGTNVGPELMAGDIGSLSNPVIICEPVATLTPAPREDVSFVYYDEMGNEVGNGSSYDLSVSGLSTITVAATDSSGCVIEMDVSVAGGPVQAFIQDTIIGCLGGPVRLPIRNDDDNDTLSFQWEPAELLNNPTSGSPTFTGEPGVYNFGVALTNQYGCSDSLSLEVIVIDEEAELSYTSEVECDGQTVNFTNTSSATFGYLWNFGDGDTSLQADPTHVYTAEGVYTVTLDIRYEQDCIESFSTEVIVDAIQLAADIDLELADCQTGQGTINFFDNTLNNTGENLAYGWTFSMGAPATSNVANPMLIVTESGDVTTTLTVFSENGCQSSYDTTFSVILPIVELPDTLVICPGDTAFLNPNFNLALTYNWIGATDFNPNAINPGTVVAGTYIVEASTTAADLNCTTFDTVVVRDGVVPALVVTGPNGEVDQNNDGPITLPDPIANDGSLITIPSLQSCGETISLMSTAQPGTSFDYTVYPGGSVLADNPVTFELNPRDTIVVLVEATSVDGCLTYDTLALYSAELIATPDIVEVVSCAGLDTVLSIMISGNTDGVLYQWTGPNINGPADGTSISITTPQEGMIDYGVSVINAAGCTDSTTVRVNVTPFVPNMYEDSLQICFDEATVLPGGDIVDGYLYDWSPLENLDLTDPNNPTVTLTEDETYTVVITDPTTGCSWVETIFVGVNNEIGLEVTPTDTLLCLPATVTLVSSVLITTADIVWYADEGLTEILGGGPRLEYDANTTGTFTIYTVATDKLTDCSVMTSSTIIVDPVDDSLPAVAVSVCANDQSTQQLFPEGQNPDYLYTYEPEGLVDFNGNFIGTESVSLIVTTTDLATGCFVLDTVEVTYTDFAPVELTADLELVVIPGSVELTVSNCDNCEFSWTTDNGMLSATDQAVVIGTPEFEGEVTYEVEVSRNGCSEILFITLPTDEPNCDELHVFLPNGFSPNGDNSNDELRVRSRFIDQNLIEVYELMIFNRWGQEMFRSFDPNEAWDGTFEGDDLEPDVFGFYLRVICPDGEELIQQGSITLLR